MDTDNTGLITVDQLVTKIRAKILSVQAPLRISQAKMKEYADKSRAEAPVYAKGDEVMIRTERLLTVAEKNAHKKKCRVRWNGPYLIKSCVNRNAYEIELPPGFRHHRVFNVNDIKRYRFTERFGQSKQPPCLFKDELGAFFQVDSVIGHEKRKGRDFYQVHWKGYSNKYDSWEPDTNLLLVKDKIQQFFIDQEAAV